ncbi:hypothetical protein C8R44DRAFT_742683 [Mycena epipterygia]|nr:hypothetical protein C8R44DRAFT_742683 [Mycena epipterygia]
MLKFVRVAVLVALQLGSIYGVSATNLSPGSSFSASLVELQNAANVLSHDFYEGPVPPANITVLEVIAGHIKSCSDAFDAATLQLVSIPTTLSGTLSGRFLSQSDAAILNAVYIPSIQTILNALNDIQAGIAFFESVNNNSLLFTIFCHWVGILSQENYSFLDQLAFAAPSANYSSDWLQLQSQAASAYNIWLTEDGFNCRGLF